MEELSAVVLLGRILDDALARGSSDVHLHAGLGDLTVHLRTAGHIEPYLHVKDLGASVIRRVKALAKMDVAESRVPQDGSFRWHTDAAECDVRAAVIPTVAGETAVLRLLSRRKEAISFTSLGMTEQQSAQLNRILQTGSGLVLAAGPTSSGKTTTLYAMMVQLARWGRHVVSIEDPVEMPLPDCQQVEVRERIGVTFDAGLRALLRHDPDVIMIGEIRDDQTARTALRASVTGHLVLSTTHAKDVAGAVQRLVGFGLPKSVVTDVLRAVVVQELRPRPCRAGCGGKACSRCRGTGVDPEREAVFHIFEMAAAPSASLDAAWAAQGTSRLVGRGGETDAPVD
ncbi:MAG: Flp pilus assembly complex ATPase component TadA [Alicyclobacillaceae bacterium]|nr:Flp pilus assembly complex ATPase component TadA [Alicyclobacillaceae bacterium]